MGNIVLKCNKCRRFYFGGKPEQIGKTDNVNSCGGQMFDTGLFYEEASVIRKISQDDAFLDAMIDLKQKDIIEYNLKMSQFKSQLAQEQSSRTQTSNKPKCPTCQSTNLRKISGLSKAGSVAMWGIFSQKVKKTWHCNSCGYEW